MAEPSSNRLFALVLAFVPPLLPLLPLLKIMSIILTDDYQLNVVCNAAFVL